jgi:hypothetical protein
MALHYTNLQYFSAPRRLQRAFIALLLRPAIQHLK